MSSVSDRCSCTLTSRQMNRETIQRMKEQVERAEEEEELAGT